LHNNYVKTVEMSLQTSNVLQKLLSLTCKGNDADLFPTYPLTTWLWTDRTLQSILYAYDVSL